LSRSELNENKKGGEYRERKIQNEGANFKLQKKRVQRKRRTEKLSSPPKQSE